MAELAGFKKSLVEEAEALVLKEFPQRILELNEILSNPPFKDFDMKEVKSYVSLPDTQAVAYNPKNGLNGLKKTAHLSEDLIPPNHKIVEYCEKYVPYARRLLEESTKLKLALQMMIPKIEDGNNFGVAIQEEALRLVELSQEEAGSQFSFVSYHAERAKLLSKVLKYPQIEDYRMAVIKRDTDEYYKFFYNIGELRRFYCRVHDFFQKNIDKLRKPRNSHVENLY